MYVCNSVRPLSTEELLLRRAALRDAIVCTGWIKLLSIFCYLFVYLVVEIYSDGTWSIFIMTIVFVIIPIQAVTGLLLFLGAVDVKPVALKVAMWLCLLVAALNTVVGLVGAIYFIRTGYNALHFLIAAFFALLTLSFFSALCHDIIITNTFIKLVECPPSSPPDLRTVGPT